eukprot:UN30911
MEHSNRALSFVENDMKDFNYNGNAYIFGECFRICAYLEDTDRAGELWKLMESRNIEPNWMCYNSLMWIYMEKKDYQKVCTLFDDALSTLPDKKLSNTLFATAMKAYLNLNEPGKVVELFNELKERRVEPDKNVIFHTMQANVRLRQLEKAFIPYQEGITLKVGPGLNQINLLLETIVDETSQERDKRRIEQLSAKALEIFDHAHSKKRCLNGHSYRLLVEIFHRINRKFTMDCMFREGVSSGSLQIWSDTEP